MKRIEWVGILACSWLVIIPSGSWAANDFGGDWKLTVEQRRGPATGLLEIREGDSGVYAHVEGGPVTIAIEGERIEMGIDGLTAGGAPLVRELTGTISGDTMQGRYGPDEPPQICIEYPLALRNTLRCLVGGAHHGHGGGRYHTPSR